MKKLAHIVITVALTTVLAASVTACGEKKEAVITGGKQDRLTLLLDWFPNPDHAGIYTGLKKHRFADQGVALKINVPSDPASVIQQVASGRADIGISYQPEVMAARDKGAKIRAVAAVVPRALTSIVYLDKSSVDEIADLKGKRVGTAGIPYQSAYLKAVLKSAGVDPTTVKEVNVGFNLQPALISGKVDAVVGAFWNVEGVELTLKKRAATVTPVDRAGVPPYDELVVIASEAAIADPDRSSRIRRFIAGLTAGTEDAKADPNAAVSALLQANKELDRKFTVASVQATLSALRPTDQNAVYGYLNPGKWDVFGKWMRDNGLLENPPRIREAYTNDLLPGSGPKR